MSTGSSAPGALVELAAVGVQNKVTNFQPQMTFFKCTWRRFTNFAKGQIAICLQNFDYGRCFDVCLWRAGDLVAQTYLYWKVGYLRYSEENSPLLDPPTIGAHLVNGYAFAILEELSLLIGSHEFDKIDGEWIFVWDSVANTDEKRLEEMVLYSPTDDRSTLTAWTYKDRNIWLPTNFYFNLAYCQSLPIAALQYHQVCLRGKLRSKDDMVVGYSWDLGTASPTEVKNDVLANDNSAAISDPALLVNYIFLDPFERKMTALVPHFYLMNQLQMACDIYRTEGQTSICADLVLSHPTIEMFWWLRRDTAFNYRLDDNSADNPNITGKNFFDFSGRPGSHPNKGSISINNDAYKTALITFNNNDRTLVFPAEYYRLVTHYEAHTTVPKNTQIYGYPFALYPEDVKPSGSVNLSRIDRTQIQFVFSSDAAGVMPDPLRTRLKVVARNHNQVTMTGGMAGLLFAN